MLQILRKILRPSSVGFAAIICLTVGCTTAKKSKSDNNWHNMQPSFMGPSGQSQQAQKSERGWFSNMANKLKPKARTVVRKDATHVDNMPIGGVNADVYTLAGQLSASQAHWIEAEKHFQKSLKINPDNINALRGQGAVLAEQDRYEEAIEYFRKAVALAEENDALELASEVSYCYMKLGQSEKAISILQSLVNKAPENEMFRHQLAYVLTKHGHANSAVEQLSVIMEPGDALMHLAGIQNELGMSAEAQVSLERANAHAPNQTQRVAGPAQTDRIQTQAEPLLPVQALASRPAMIEGMHQQTNQSADLQPIQVASFDAAQKREEAESRIREKIELIQARVEAADSKKKPMAKFRPLSEKVRPVARFHADKDETEKTSTSSSKLPSNIELLLR